MIRILTLFSIIIINTIPVFNQPSADYLDYNSIRYSENRVIELDSASVAWGKEVIKELGTDNLSEWDRAMTIKNFLHSEIKYNTKRRLEIAEIIEKKNGFCISHAMMGLFLLRMAGVEAKFAHEVNILKKGTLLSFFIGRYAIKNNDGINSYWHNDHVWVWVFVDGRWEPFDSALGLFGYDEFYTRRYYNHSGLSKGLAQKWTGPPFAVFEENELGLTGMVNVTKRVWNRESLPEGTAMTEEWLELVDIFAGYTKKNFYDNYLPDSILVKVEHASNRWFFGDK